MEDKLSYAEAGVDTKKEEKGLKDLIALMKETFLFSDIPAILDLQYFANILDLGDNIGLALSTDGVGTKIMVAQMMDKYDTIGIDCIAMNVNDILCVGAKPISMLDYIALQTPDHHLLKEIAKGLYEGAKIAQISIPGGEIAQIREMLSSEREGYGFDLVGTAIGLVPLDKVIIGQDISEGDVLIGLRSSGIHSNGLTLARKVFFERGRFKIKTFIDELGRTLGEELLEPTHIYVPEVKEMLKTGLKIKGLVHITSDGLLNLFRVKADCGYVIDNLPEAQPIFRLIQEIGKISTEEMFRVYNMGIGFCLILPEGETDKVFGICKRYNTECYKIGYVTGTEKRIIIEKEGLIGKGGIFFKY